MTYLSCSPLPPFQLLAMDSLKQFASGFKMPDWQKVWSGLRAGGSDAPDAAGTAEQPLMIQLEPTLVRLQELALWTEPWKSVVALAIVQVRVRAGVCAPCWVKNMKSS